eukprot:gnl/MRDRNA2_/MRDRNA2_115630_c0_seq1.p1 gnl/MRDRNA2_/MRDRNA2_115630_c0~~gnl/MRDRNA2_/MRDRNA2_115630_c0_seq1.p1  ORF type:complete len:560 (-),score=116.37 gnl/MRDRNA2_/MRDRNA2_115630_c0_seq1:95-1684(-)
MADEEVPIEDLEATLAEVQAMDEDDLEAIDRPSIPPVGSSPADQSQQLMQLFDAFDMDNTGTLGIGELWGILQHCTGQKQDYQQVCAIMARFDASGDGQLSLEEFMNLFYPPNNPPPKPAPPSDPTLHDTDDGMFVDSEFPPNGDSLGPCQGVTPDMVTWIRAPDLTPGNDELFANIEPNDIAQGALGDCWFLAGIAALAEFPGAIENCFQTKKINEKGMYKVKMWNGSSWEQIIIDDLIPCVSGQPAFSRPAGNELWVVLLEKALAKWCGNYAATEGGFENFCWEMLTGAPNQVGYQNPDGAAGQWQALDVKFPDLHAPHGIQATASSEGSCSPDDMWNKLCDFDDKNYVMGASTNKEGEDSGQIGHSGGEHIRADGIVKGHAYSLITATEAEGFKMVQLRNPWGNDAEWKGAFSDHSSDWSQNPELAQALGYGCKPDGVFWMTWEDFQECYDAIWVSQKTMSTPQRQVIQNTAYQTEGVTRALKPSQAAPYSRSNPEANGRKVYSMAEKACGRAGACHSMTGGCSIM